jgi:hypothetical protein
MAEYVRVKEPFAYGNDVFGAGEIWSTDNPAYKGREQFFESVEVAAVRSSVATETASAEPGGSRARSKRLGSKPSVKEPAAAEEEK